MSRKTNKPAAKKPKARTTVTKAPKGKKAIRPETPASPVVDAQANDPKPVERASRGRPTLYTDETAKRLCAELALGKSLSSICNADVTLPAPSTVLGWALDDKHPFFDQYARARLIGYHVMADGVLDEADDGRNDYMKVFDKDGEATGWKLNGEHVQRSRLRVETRKWVISKMLPKIYGDKLEIDTPPDGGLAKATKEAMTVTTTMLAGLVNR